MEDELLLVPGPVAVAKNVLKAQTKQMISHRNREFEEIYRKVCNNLKTMFNSDEAVLQTGSGSAGIETLVASAVAQEDYVLALNNGDFGRRLVETCRVYSNNVEEFILEEGKGFNLERVKGKLDENSSKPNKIFALAYNETATGVENKLKEMALYAKEKGYWVLVDSVSAFAGTDLNMKEWKVDITATGSQKAIGAPPGLSMIGMNREIIEKINRNNIRSYYLNLKKLLKFREKNQTPFTPAVSTLYALEGAIDDALEMGFEKYIAKHRKAARYVRKELVKRNFALFAEKGFESNTVTAFVPHIKEGENMEEVVKNLKKKLEEKGAIIAGGQGNLKGKILRIAHLGNFKMGNLRRFFEILDESVG